MVAGNYQHIWDTCCDHGLLGEALLRDQIANKPSVNKSTVIHFVDIVPNIMSRITHKLQQHFAHCTPLWKTHCLDLANLPIACYEGKHLLIISGISGELMANLIIRFVKQHSVEQLNNIEFLLCPAHGQLALRSALIALNFSLSDESLVEDNQRFYEVLRVSPQITGTAISLVGDKIWHYPRLSSRYLTKILNHYQRKQAGYLKSRISDRYDSEIKTLQKTINAYKAVKLAK